jgi:hypothetical protein
MAFWTEYSDYRGFEIQEKSRMSSTTSHDIYRAFAGNGEYLCQRATGLYVLGPEREALLYRDARSVEAAIDRYSTQVASDDRKIKIVSAPLNGGYFGKWYVAKGDTMYLYRDGTFRFMCIDHKAGETGYYETREEAAEALFEYYYRRADGLSSAQP